MTASFVFHSFFFIFRPFIARVSKMAKTKNGKSGTPKWIPRHEVEFEHASEGEEQARESPDEVSDAVIPSGDAVGGRSAASSADRSEPSSFSRDGSTADVSRGERDLIAVRSYVDFQMS
jgi:hypothetical protein